MKKKIFALVLPLICISVLGLIPIGSGMSQVCDPDCHLGAAEYYAVLNRLFSREGIADVHYVLRFLPAREPERQIVIVTKPDRSYEVYYYSLPTGAARIWDQLLRLRISHPNDTLVQLADSIKVQHVTVHISPNVISGLMDSLRSLKIPAELDNEIVMDGSGYDFWYIAPSACKILHLSTSDADYGHDKGAHPLVQWMNNVRVAVQKAELSKTN